MSIYCRGFYLRIEHFARAPLVYALRSVLLSLLVLINRCLFASLAKSIALV